MMDIEVAAWLILNGVGLVFAAWDLFDALVDRQLVDLIDEAAEEERIEAFHAALAQGARIVVLLGLMSLGILAAVKVLSSSLFRTIMFVVAGVVTADSVRARRHRKRLIEVVRRSRRAKE